MLRKALSPPDSGPVRVERYKGRHWAVYDRSGLVAVTVYRRGARAVAERLRRPRSRPKKGGRSCRASRR